MIALQTRSPQLPDPAAQTAKFVNMMNMTKQQEAAERQAAQAQQAMEFARTGEARAVETQTATMREKNADFQDKELKRLGRIGVTVLRTEDPALREAAYQNLLGEVEKADPRLGATMRQVAPNFNAAVVESAVMEVDKYFGLKYPTPVASLELGVDGSPRSVTVGGLNPEQRPVYDAPEMPMAAPRATPTAPTNPMAQNAPAPNAAGEAPGSLGLVVASALQTRVMSQADLDKMLANVQPASRPKIMNWVRENGINVAPDAPPLVDNQMRDTPMSYDGKTPQSQFAVMRGQPMQSQTAGLSGAPEMQQTLAQTQPRTSTKLQQRNPNISPTPGIYGVPTQDVAATSRATRPSKQEMYDAEAAKIQAARDAGPPPVTAQQKIARKTEVAQAYSKTQTLIDKAYNPKEGIISIANKIKMLSPDQKEAITGYSGYVPSFRESSREADTLFGNLKGVVTSLGKDAAAASGAVGNMAVQEWKIAADMIANLDLANMTPRALDAQMDRIIEQVSNATKLAERVYGIQYGEDVKQYPDFKLRGTPPAKTKTPVVKGGSRISPDIDKILKSRGI
jgi:hypothetical protein